MFDTEDITPKTYNFINGQIDIILKALELYAFNLHNTWGLNIDDNLNNLRNDLLFYTYESLLAQRKEYNSSYDLAREHILQKNRKKKRIYYSNKKNIA